MSNTDILHNLRDNHSYSYTKGYALDGGDSYDKSFLRYIGSHTVSEMVSDNLLVFPDSFMLGNSSGQVVDYIEPEDEYEPATIYTNNYLGFIGKGDTELHIRSRFGNAQNDYFIHYMLMRISGLATFDMPTGYTDEADNIYNLLLYFFPQMLISALSSGLIKTYVDHKYNDSHVRGKIDVERHIRVNEPFTGKAAYNVREFSYDNNVTELVRHTIEYMRTLYIGRKILDSSQLIRRAVSCIIENTKSYRKGDLQRMIDANTKLIIHPLYHKYRKLQKLCLAILRHKKVNYAESKEKIHGLLFDGAWLWEEYISRVLGGEFSHLTIENSRERLFHELSGVDFQHIVPDYLNREKHAIADAKYIPLDLCYRQLNADKAGDIYYKTIMYMYRYNSKEGYLIYPAGKELRRNTLEIISTQGILSLIGLPVDMEGDFEEYCRKMNAAEKEMVSACFIRQ